MILVIDNYDSFTYNLVQYLGELGERVQVFRNDAISVDEVIALKPDAIVVSPGPCTPNEAGISTALVLEAGPFIPILGVCLGHQCIGAAFGGRIIRAGELMHGKSSQIHHDGRGVFLGLPDPFDAIRYHSLVIERSSIPGTLEITAETDQGLIMGVRHHHHPIEGVQFHPESIMTAVGKDLLGNFLTQAHAWKKEYIQGPITSAKAATAAMMGPQSRAGGDRNDPRGYRPVSQR